MQSIKRKIMYIIDTIFSDFDKYFLHLFLVSNHPRARLGHYNTIKIYFRMSQWCRGAMHIRFVTEMEPTGARIYDVTNLKQPLQSCTILNNDLWSNNKRRFKFGRQSTTSDDARWRISGTSEAESHARIQWAERTGGPLVPIRMVEIRKP